MILSMEDKRVRCLLSAVHDNFEIILITVEKLEIVKELSLPLFCSINSINVFPIS